MFFYHVINVLFLTSIYKKNKTYNKYIEIGETGGERKKEQVLTMFFFCDTLPIRGDIVGNKRAELVPAAKERAQLVTESNNFILGSNFKLTAQEKKILMFLVSKVHMFDTEFKEYSFSVQDFCRVCGINPQSGSTSNFIKSSLKSLADKSVWVRRDNGDQALYRLLNRVEIKDGDSVISVSFHDTMKEFLLDLKENFTSYELIWALGLKSKYAIRLYEICCCIHFDELKPYERYFSIDELRKLIWAETYTTYQTFKTRALNPAIEEINNVSNKKVSYRPVKEGRSIIGIVLTVETREARERFLRYEKINLRLDKGDEGDGQ